MAEWNPQKKSRKILDRGWEHVQSVSYQVSARWLFYRLLQDGFYKAKDDYRNQFIPLFAEARKRYFQEWCPWSLVDESREMVIRARGDRDADDWVTSLSKNGLYCSLDFWYSQDVYTLLMYEANAMTAQFQHYTPCDLVPFGGCPGVYYKYQVAKHIEMASEKYELPVLVLYFGDLDPKGLEIPESALKDIREWCKVDFEFQRVGLNPGQEKKYNIPENPEKPGCYQWEALTDETAGDLITNAIAPYVNDKMIRTIRNTERAAEKAFEVYVKGFADFWFAERQKYM